jgi:pilus assembly protein CpaF
VIGAGEEALLRRVRGRLVAEGGDLGAARVATLVRDEARLLAATADPAAALQAAAALRAELDGAGPLQPLLADPEVTDVLVDGPDTVLVDRGAGLLQVPHLRFRDEAELRRLAVRLAATAGRRLDEACPWVDVRLPDVTDDGRTASRVRLHAVVPPVAQGGTHLSLRVLRQQDRTLPWLVAHGGLPAEAAELLARVVAARASFVVTGGTGSGKTTLLSALLSVVPATERIVLVEDTGELLPRHPHVVRLEGRPANVEGAGAVGLSDLVRQALRMRPDRIVVGEVRGGEVVDLLAALNTGHEGSCGTLHARSTTAVPARVEALATAAGLDRAAVHSQLAAGLDLVVHLERSRGVRRLAALGVLERVADGSCVVEVAWSPAGRGRAWARLAQLLEDGRRREDGQ